MFFHGNVNKEEKLKRVIFLFYGIKNIKHGAVTMVYFIYNLMRVTVKHPSKCYQKMPNIYAVG
jgi:hypothetical protein